MSAVAKRRAPRPMPVYAEVEVDPHDLEMAGWVYVGRDKSDSSTITHAVDARVTKVVEQWHLDRGHELPWCWCRDDLCRAVQDAETSEREGVDQ